VVSNQPYKFLQKPTFYQSIQRCFVDVSTVIKSVEIILAGVVTSIVLFNNSEINNIFFLSTIQEGEKFRDYHNFFFSFLSIETYTFSPFQSRETPLRIP
jgi:hypothetical protein